MKDINAMVESLATDRLEDAYQVPDLRMVENLIASLTVNGDEDLGSDERDMLEKLRARKSELRSADVPAEIPFVFLKLRPHEHDKALTFFETTKQRELNRLLKEGGKDRKEALLTGIENDLMLAVASDEDMGYQTRQALVHAILDLEGLSAAAIGRVSEDHPGLELSEDQEKAWALTDDLPPDVYYERLEKRDAAIEEIQRVKRENILEAQQNERNDRLTDLMAYPTDRLASAVVVREFEVKANEHAHARLRDFFLRCSARNPERLLEIKQGSRTRMVPARMWDDVDDITALREGSEGEQDLYVWLAQRYAEMQQLETAGDIRRVALSDTFL